MVAAIPLPFIKKKKNYNGSDITKKIMMDICLTCIVMTSDGNKKGIGPIPMAKDDTTNDKAVTGIHPKLDTSYPILVA